MGKRDEYVWELATTVTEMFAVGTTDPSAVEIAQAHFPGKALGGEIHEGIRKRLHRIRDVLSEDFGHPVYLLNTRYYARFRGKPPTTAAEARLCLPIGQGVTANGIGLQTDPATAAIFQAALSMNVASGAGKLKKSIDSTVDAVERHHLNEEDGAAIIRDASRRSEPEHSELAKAIGVGRVQPTLPVVEPSSGSVAVLPMDMDIEAPQADVEGDEDSA
ncbi:MAG TPA: hypothetical protein DGB72_01815 [Gemmatimonadetes bacterium]|jgi:hypothetical protein|nr:hypothetical protein [Chloroflexota bacterium]HAF20685.1 hypothetical protein [Chloroflexota bacterium]HCU10841.1 hypothetical protein [Gemmatimonadota bacterium]